jgi:Phosphoribosylformylglycinamidine (FGAM) synthase, synthetase domain
MQDIRLSLQEYFERIDNDPIKWGKPCAALLGALLAQNQLGLAAIGGKDSMSGTFRDEVNGQELNVPPTLITFAASAASLVNIVSPEFKRPDSTLYLLHTPMLADETPDFDEYKRNMETLHLLISRGKVFAAHTVRQGGILEAVCKMGFGNMIGSTINDSLSLEDLTTPLYGSVVIEGFLGSDLIGLPKIEALGKTNNNGTLEWKGERIKLSELLPSWQEPLEAVFPTKALPSARPENKTFIEPQDYFERSDVYPKPVPPSPEWLFWPCLVLTVSMTPSAPLSWQAALRLILLSLPTKPHFKPRIPAKPLLELSAIRKCWFCPAALALVMSLKGLANFCIRI